MTIFLGSNHSRLSGRPFNGLIMTYEFTQDQIKQATRNRLNRFEFEGEMCTIQELAFKLDANYSTFRQRIYQFGIDEAVRISRLNKDDYKAWYRSRNQDCEAKRYYPYKGKQYSALELAKLFNVPKGTFTSWQNRHGHDYACYLGEMEPKQRKALMNKNRSIAAKKSSKILNPDIPANDPDYELKNQIESYRALGWSDDDIVVKKRVCR